MRLENVIKGKILKRYKRFLSDIELADGQIVHAHVPNTGSMKTCWDQGWDVILTDSKNPKRKMPLTLEMTHNGFSWISVNTARTNKLVQEALEKKIIKECESYQSIKAEKKVGDSRIDFFLSDSQTQKDCYLEVKNVTLKDEDGHASFPDSVSKRAQKHIKELIQIKRDGFRSILFFLINREDVSHFEPARQIDPDYASLLVEAQKEGVEILCYQSSLNESEIVVSKKINYIL